MVRPKDSRTTLRPSDTINSKKNESALRPASKIATAQDSSNCELHSRSVSPTDDQEHSRCGASTVSIEVAIVGWLALCEFGLRTDSLIRTPVGDHFDYEEAK